jgi:hypothetical protein
LRVLRLVSISAAAVPHITLILLANTAKTTYVHHDVTAVNACLCGVRKMFVKIKNKPGERLSVAGYNCGKWNVHTGLWTSTAV